MPRSLNPVERETKTFLLETASGFKSCTAIWLVGENPSRGVYYNLII